MAEFCLECWNKLNNSHYSEKKYIISDYLDLCEGCGELKPVIVIERKACFMHKFRYFIFPVKIIYVLCKLVLLPFLIIHYAICVKKKKQFYFLNTFCRFKTYSNT